MSKTNTIPTGMLERLRTLHREVPSIPDTAVDELGLRPLTDAGNNRVYAWTSPDGGEVCLKLYQADTHHRALREYLALSLLPGHGITAAPQALWHLPDPELSAIAMTLVPGTPLPDQPGTKLPGLREVAATLGELRKTPLGPFTQIPRLDPPSICLRHVIVAWPHQLSEQVGDPVTADLMAVLGTWRAHRDAAVLAEKTPLVFSHGNSNLANWLWDDTTGMAYALDWDSAGCSDTAWDTASLIEHPTGRAIPDSEWCAVLPDLGIRHHSIRRRFHAAQRTVAMHWLAVRWQRRHEHAAAFHTQLQRARVLLDTDPR